MWTASARYHYRRSYGQCWCSASGGDLFLGSFDRLPVTEANALDQLGEPVRPVQVAPVALGRFGELEDHRERSLSREAALRLGRPQPNGGKGTFDRVRGPHMFPVLGG